MKSLLLHIHDDLGQDGRLRAALDIAKAQGAFLRCVQVTALSQYVATDPFGGSYILPENLKVLRDAEAAHRGRVEAMLGGQDIGWGWSSADGDVAHILLREARLADLLVVTLATQAGGGIHAPLPIVAELAVHAKCPVLAVPVGCEGVDCAGPALVAWNGSHEAAHALRGAVPLLAKASAVHIVSVEEEDIDFPASSAAEYLSRHGIASRPRLIPTNGRSVEEVLNAQIAELAPGLVVMGAYGHSRLREILFGGVTRHLLKEASVPLLLSH